MRAISVVDKMLIELQIIPKTWKLLLGALCLFANDLGAQESNPLANNPQIAEQTRPQKPLRPSTSDKASLQLIENYLTVIGGRTRYEKIENYTVSGTIREGLNDRDFELIETSDGKRWFKTEWRQFGRPHSELQIFDGEKIWKQSLEPKQSPLQFLAGQDAIHFAKQAWFVRPFHQSTDYIFRYGGPGKVGPREVYIVIGYAPNGERSWFYFDKENSLLLRWGGYGLVAGSKLAKDYQSAQFKRVDGLLLPQYIDLLAEGKSYGKIEIDSLRTNTPIAEKLFYRPQDRTPTLRQLPRSL